MSDSRSRREFLKITAGGVVSLAASDMLAGNSGPSDLSPSPDSRISRRITDNNRKYASGPSLQWKSSPPTTTGDAIAIRAEKRYQPVLGFGAAFTDAACYMFSQLTPAERARLFHELFSPEEMGLLSFE